MTATMTGRAVDAPLERLYEELRRLRRKAGDVSYGYIARKNTRGLSKTTVAAIFTGQGRVGPPSWENIACVFDVLHDKLDSTGVDTDSLGTKQGLYQLHQQAVDALVSQTPRKMPARLPVDQGQVAAQPSSTLSADLTSAAADTSKPPPMPCATDADASLGTDLARELDTLLERDDLGDGPRPWPALEDLPGELVPASTPAPPSSPGEGGGLSTLVIPDLASGKLQQKTLPEPRPGARQPEEETQPVEKEASFAVWGAPSRGQATVDRIRNWFGPCGLQLLHRADNGDELAAFRLGVLLINRDAPKEGGLFLQRAAGMNPKFRLTLPDLAVRDRLCGIIVTDICQRIADAYDINGMPAMAERWNTYIDTIDTRFPLAVLLHRRIQPIGRHARDISHDLIHLETNEIRQISTIYWPKRMIGAPPKTRPTDATAPHRTPQPVM
ncbi:hypothetical protein AB0C27_53625 [Nonomuraea sp. NPDC048882]|uniref:hypothetical protein n=1 Tax=Nonomuraea sp. NPDC048882 TaxID=3154347 RepID=UPI0033D64F55